MILQTANERLAFAQARGCVFARCRKKRVLGGPPCAKLYGGIALDFSLFFGDKKMSPWLIIVTGAIYAYIGLEQGLKGNLAMAIVYSGYAFSNVGLYYLALK